ncbi:hypothetical protein G7K_5218-t1 [Saitoella complicata NRRL Y-17804]|uniref:Uncharacterized protein n=1 Tax=Saitoella complicata (strain BCRC 22490 / CBS 7301 / JCM 7358 / NBRC 10748 / NRRL Y-17804) TaxID=698492 RepID=A0A0E9NMK0_SAICN|nr:hypothetical protein G7K_5218-t1 [Saitoella complicata NRRL Y-17804]
MLRDFLPWTIRAEKAQRRTDAPALHCDIDNEVDAFRFTRAESYQNLPVVNSAIRLFAWVPVYFPYLSILTHNLHPTKSDLKTPWSFFPFVLEHLTVLPFSNRISSEAQTFFYRSSHGVCLFTPFARPVEPPEDHSGFFDVRVRLYTYQFVAFNLLKPNKYV